MLAKRIPKGFSHTAPVSVFYRRVPNWRLLPKCICKTYIWILFIHKTDGKVRSKGAKNVWKENRPVQKSSRWKPEIACFSIPHNRNIKSNVLWTVCHIQFLKQNISYCVSVLKVIFPLLFVDCLHYLTLKSPRGFWLFHFLFLSSYSSSCWNYFFQMVSVVLPVPKVLYWSFAEFYLPSVKSRHFLWP